MNDGSCQTIRWSYDPGEKPKRKHGWSKDEAGFERRGRAIIGKCPKNLTNETAEDLINDGIPENDPRAGDGGPRRIYVVYDGVLYRAVATEPGKSYHGFPERPQEYDELDDDLRERIEARARQLGQLRDLRKWLRQNRKSL
jgi:hypothetical protein